MQVRLRGLMIEGEVFSDEEEPASSASQQSLAQFLPPTAPANRKNLNNCLTEYLKKYNRPVFDELYVHYGDEYSRQSQGERGAG